MYFTRPAALSRLYLDGRYSIVVALCALCLPGVEDIPDLFGYLVKGKACSAELRSEAHLWGGGRGNGPIL